MKNRTGIGLFLFLLSAIFVTLVTGSAWLQDPPSRSAAWYYQIKAPVNYNFRNLDCGGVPVRVNIDGSRNCGVCGDAAFIKKPRPNENGGRYANPIIRTRYYETGQEAEISIWNNLPGSPGYYEFRLCADGLNLDQECLNRNLLTIKETNRTVMPVPKKQGFIMLHVQLPVGVTCDFCVLQWRFRKENSVEGCDGNNWCGLGRGPQIEYYNCADVMIGQVGQPKPSFIQDPVYSSADYGSAYDVSTTRTTQKGGGRQTTPQSGGLGGSTPATQIPIFTIPTLPPQSSPNPAGTTPGPGLSTERLVVDASGNAIGTTLTGSSSTGSNNNNRQLLLLIGLLPLLGAAALTNNNRVPPALFPQQGVPLSSYYLGASTGFGNFGPGGFPASPGTFVGAPVGFSSGFASPVAFAPGRFGRSVSESDENSTDTQNNETRNEDTLLYDPGNEINNIESSNLYRISTNMVDLKDPDAERDDSYNNVQINKIINVFPRSVNSDVNFNSGEVEEESDLESISHERHQRSSGSEYGQTGTVYGNRHSMSGQRSTFSGGQDRNFGQISDQRFSGVQTQSTMDVRQNFKNRFNGNSGKMLMQRRKMRNGQRRQGTLSQNPSNVSDTEIIEEGMNGRGSFKSKMPSDTFRTDFKELLGSLDKTRGFQANVNPFARRFFRDRKPTPHDWYMKLMSLTEPLNPQTK